MVPLKKLGIVGFMVLIILLIVEIALRFLGFNPYETPQYSFDVSPYFCYDSDSLGITLKPGIFQIDINGGLKFTATHSIEGHRESLSPSDSASFVVHIYGCSYTYGTGVTDQAIYPTLLQQEHPELAITNFATPGYGTLQFYLQLKENIAKQNIPDIAILNVASFHEERNLLSKSYLYKLYQGHELFGEVVSKERIYPRIKEEEPGISVEYINLFEAFHPFVGRKYSSIINLLEQFTLQEPSSLSSTFTILAEISMLCKTEEIDLIIADVDSSSNEIKSFCLKNNLNYTNISPDFTQDKYRNMPLDFHPSEEAHKVYAEKVAAILAKH